MVNEFYVQMGLYTLTAVVAYVFGFLTGYGIDKRGSDD